MKLGKLISTASNSLEKGNFWFSYNILLILKFSAKSICNFSKSFKLSAFIVTNP